MPTEANGHNLKSSYFTECGSAHVIPKLRKQRQETAASSRQTGLHNEASQKFKLRGEMKKALSQAVINTFYHQLVFAHHT